MHPPSHVLADCMKIEDICHMLHGICSMQEWEVRSDPGLHIECGRRARGAHQTPGQNAWPRLKPRYDALQDSLKAPTVTLCAGRLRALMFRRQHGILSRWVAQVSC